MIPKIVGLYGITRNFEQRWRLLKWERYIPCCEHLSKSISELDVDIIGQLIKKHHHSSYFHWFWRLFHCIKERGTFWFFSYNTILPGTYHHRPPRWRIFYATPQLHHNSHKWIKRVEKHKINSALIVLTILAETFSAILSKIYLHRNILD